jgi:polyhydroxyalkanoate synthesis regulator phasin
MDEQELYDEIELLRDELEKGEINVEEGIKRLDELLSKVDKLIENKLDEINDDYDMDDLYEDD